MSIQETLEKIKPFYTLILLVVVASIFFALGRLSALESRHTPIKIENTGESQTGAVINAVSDTSSAIPAVVTQSGAVVGSKSGKKYYFPWCSTAKRMKPENQVQFASVADAKAAGYVAGGNCKGLK